MNWALLTVSGMQPWHENDACPGQAIDPGHQDRSSGPVMKHHWVAT